MACWNILLENNNTGILIDFVVSRRQTWIFFVEEKVLSILYMYINQYHDCWWSEDARTLCINSQIIDLFPPVSCIRLDGTSTTLQWRHNGHDGVSNRQSHHCFLSRKFGRRTKKTSKLHVNGLCVGNSPVTGEFLAQKASNAEKVSIWWRHHVRNGSYQQSTKNSQAGVGVYYLCSLNLSLGGLSHFQS